MPRSRSSTIRDTDAIAAGSSCPIVACTESSISPTSPGWPLIVCSSVISSMLIALPLAGTGRCSREMRRLRAPTVSCASEKTVPSSCTRLRGSVSTSSA